MYRIIDERGSGKTSRLMLLAKETGAVIACSNPQAMRQKALAYGIVGIDFVSYHQITVPGNDYNNVLIDELEAFTQYILGRNNLMGYSMSKDD